MGVKKFNCIRINDFLNNKYLLKIKYKDLVEITEINKLSVNRIVDETKASKMISFIKQNNKFYPTIIMVVSDKCDLEYDNTTSTLLLKSNEDKLLGVVDGQHRYKSIELMLKSQEIEDDKKDRLKEKEQAVFLIDKLTNQQQRDLFLEINGTPNKVKKGTQLRLDISTYNYYGLRFLNENSEYLCNINFDEDQVLKKNEKRLPYKFILKSNAQLLKDFENNYEKNLIPEDDLNKYYQSIEEIWKFILTRVTSYMSKSDTIKDTVYSLEIYYTTIFDEIYKKCKALYEDITDENIKAEFNKLKPFFDIYPVELKKEIDKLFGSRKVECIKKIIEEHTKEQQ
ncbi:DNA sulfur modification protein DndB [Clostridium ljungdahlii]|uniref:DNA sulfur modification protein DndB n=1 Tax=Clostridium ljungdahlii TaxID=1538 RepID=UPI00386BF643